MFSIHIKLKTWNQLHMFKRIFTIDFKILARIILLPEFWIAVPVRTSIITLKYAADPKIIHFPLAEMESTIDVFLGKLRGCKRSDFSEQL